MQNGSPNQNGPHPFGATVFYIVTLLASLLSDSKWIIDRLSESRYANSNRGVKKDDFTFFLKYYNYFPNLKSQSHLHLCALKQSKLCCL